MQFKKVLVFLPLLVLAFAGCNGKDIFPTLIESYNEAPGSNCEYGGVRFELGPDTNEDGVLDDSEVVKKTYACHMIIDGKTSKVVVTPENPGSHCTEGGYKIESGLDKNQNNKLDASEIESTSYVCDGLNGQDGDEALVRLSNVPADPNGACYFGGTKIESGTDLDKDHFLDANEVTSTQYVCSVHVNENMTLVKNSVELPGSNCVNGGVKTQVGYDDDNDKVLDPAEVDSTSYVCNILITVPGKSTLMITSPATVNQCPNGGTVFQSGLDNNYNNILEAGEVTNTSLVCNGFNGYDSVVRNTPYNGVQCGDAGGYKFEVGLDFNGNGSLDNGEIQNISYICNGEDGFIGYDGANSLIRIYDAGSACGPQGGYRMETGLDINANGVLEFAEVEDVNYVCNGYDGYSTLVEIYDDSTVCPNGGIRIESGLDTDNSGVLDFDEVQNIAYVCDGL